MNTVFGEEHFLDSTMVYVAKQTDNIILDEIHKATVRVGVQVDEEKLKRWLKLCGELEHIDESALIDIATQKKFADKDQQIRSLEEQLIDAEEHIDALELQLREQYQLVDEKDEQLKNAIEDNKKLQNTVKNSLQ